MNVQAERVTVMTDCGPVCGKKQAGKTVFLGIPYGKAERFKAPEPVKWTETRDCTAFGPIAPQPNYRGRKPENFVFAMKGSEDCLNLNVWTTSTDPAAKLPVVFAVHGGAFQVGCNSEPLFNGDVFMGEEQMVYVSVNYRVGVMGFLELGEVYGEEYLGSGNSGFKDLLLGLQWVYRNAAAFGGDPERIILTGLSAGAKALGALMTLPEVQAISHRVFLESGAMQGFRTVETAGKVAERFRAMLPDGLDLRTAPADLLVEKQAEFCSCDGNTCFFGPVLTAPFSEDWMERWEQGERFRGKALIGCGRHELEHQVRKPYFPEMAEQIAQDMFGKNADIACRKAEEGMRSGKTLQEAWEPVFSDFMYRFYSFALAKKLESEGNEVWCYSFEYKPGCHGMGFAYLMKLLDYPVPIREEEKLEEAKQVSEAMREKILAFVREDGFAEDVWPRYRGGNVMLFDRETRVEYLPECTLDGFPPMVYDL